MVPLSQSVSLTARSEQGSRGMRQGWNPGLLIFLPEASSVPVHSGPAAATLGPGTECAAGQMCYWQKEEAGDPCPPAQPSPAQLPFLPMNSFPGPRRGSSPSPDRASWGALRPGLKWSEDPRHPRPLLPSPSWRIAFQQGKQVQLKGWVWLPGHDLPSQPPSLIPLSFLAGLRSLFGNLTTNTG